MVLKFIQVAADINISFIFLLSYVPLFEHITICLFILLLVKITLFEDIMNTAVMKILIGVFPMEMYFIFLS